MQIVSNRCILLSCVVAILSQCPTTVQSEQLQWPYNLPPHVKYYPEDEGLFKRETSLLQKLQRQPANGVRKMNSDPSEKFFLDYWSFDGEEPNEDESSVSNATTFYDADTPLSLHLNQSIQSRSLPSRLLPLLLGGSSPFAKRDFGCPTGTQSCASIDRPGTCCPASTTCQIVPDVGLGDVGCCEASKICAGSPSTCPSGYSSCPNNPGGGCCLPGYACYGAGCVLTSTTVVVVAPSSSSSSTSTVPPSTTTTTSVVVVTPTTSTSSSSSLPISTSTSVSTTTIQTTSTALVSPSTSSLSCSSGFRSCPVSLGGGCCATDRACGSDVCPALTSSATAGVPVRPTTVTTSAATLTSSSSIAGCPTGFYACSAYYQGGCCQVGRDCAKTSCPAASSTTVVNTNGVSAVAPTGTYLSGHSTLVTGTCATGWYTCASTLGGGCCPSGYACGTAACSATASGGGSNQVGKISPNGAPAMVTISVVLTFWTFLFMSFIIMVVF